MKRTTKLGQLLRARRAALRLTQRSFAEKLGVEVGHVAFIESGRRKPSLKLVARIADSLGLDRQDVLFLARPEARALLSPRESEPRKTPPLSWQRFIKNRALIDKIVPILEQHRELTTILMKKERA
jgi:transcriptional regulator with XRE-family HTH domain